jgi:hypothetical protein
MRARDFPRPVYPCALQVNRVDLARTPDHDEPAATHAGLDRPSAADSIAMESAARLE